MTETNITEQFFKVFGVKSTSCNVYENYKQCEGMVECSECASAKQPKITADVLLRLILLYNDYETIIGKFNTVEDFKNYILKGLITLNGCILNVNRRHKFYNQVRSLFEEENLKTKLEISPDNAEIEIRVKGEIPQQYVEMIENIKKPILYDIELKNVIPFNIFLNQEFEQKTLILNVRSAKYLKSEVQE